MVVDKKLYDTLDLKPNCSQDEIKKAYRILAKKWHPDKNKSPDAELKFKEIATAYEILGDEEKRSMYDQYGIDGVSSNRHQGMNPNGVPMDIFNQFFGQRSHSQQRRSERNEYQLLEVSLEDAYNGATLEINLNRTIKCVGCNGFGTKKGVVPPKCNICGGKGKQVKMLQLGPGMMQQSIITCPKCNGIGNIITSDIQCLQCKGSKLVKSMEKINIAIKPGTSENTQIKFPNLASYNPQNPSVLDLVYVIKYKPHKTFFVKQVNGKSLLFVKQSIKLGEAITGAVIKLKHLNGKNLVIRTPRGYIIKPDDVLGVRDVGFPDIARKTNNPLYIIFDIVFPESYTMSDEKLNILKNVFNIKDTEYKDNDLYISLFDSKDIIEENDDLGGVHFDTDQEHQTSCNQQ